MLVCISPHLYVHHSKNYRITGILENIYPIVSQHIESENAFLRTKAWSGRPKKSRWQSWLELSRMRGHKPVKKHGDAEMLKPQGTAIMKPQCTQPVD
ncbi:hypothetical protein Bca52824_028471 [Brassica carinata]|uniref:Uncharacterized protein n=1 Tax=Brassica carinata TaxID=52824 RepID=A0A8X8AQ19_BRACI|nr:hypothetical protein Bca52824_028471 [Brassica carinata]